MFPTIFSLALRDAGTKTKLTSSLLIMTIMGGAVAPIIMGYIADFSKTYPSFLTLKEGSTSHLGLLPSGKKRETALRCSEPLRSKVGGPSKVFAILCGMGPPGDMVNSLQFTFGGFDDKLLIYCEFLGILEYAYRHNPINGLC